MNEASPFEAGLERGPANFQPVTPLGFLERAAAVYPERTAVVYGARRTSYRDFYSRCRRLASALAGRGLGSGAVVAVMAPNVPALLEAHFGVPMAGAVLNRINVRLDSATIAGILEHGGARLVICDRAYGAVMTEALGRLGRTVPVIAIDDADGPGGEFAHEADYETFLETGDPNFQWARPEDEWQAISLNYTSGTTGEPKGVVYHHRGAYLNVLGNALAWSMPAHPGLSLDAAHVPLQRLVLSVDCHRPWRHPRVPAPGRARRDLRRHRGPLGHPTSAPPRWSSTSWSTPRPRSGGRRAARSR